MPENGTSSRRSVLKTGLTALACCLATRTAAADDDEYQQPKLDRTMVRYQSTPGPDEHHCGVCTNFVDPAACRVVDGVISPAGYCLSFAPADVDFK